MKQFALGLLLASLPLHAQELPAAQVASIAAAQAGAWTSSAKPVREVMPLFGRDATNSYTPKLSVRGGPWPVGRPPIPPASAEKQLAAFGTVLLCAPSAIDQPCRPVESFNVARRSAR